jgi:WD40 repeat protein
MTIIAKVSSISSKTKDLDTNPKCSVLSRQSRARATIHPRHNPPPPHHETRHATDETSTITNMTSPPNQVQSSLPPAQPSYVLRGHAAQVHALRFWKGNSRLLSGDAEGWVILWDVSTKRAVAVWKAHGSAILGVNVWGENTVLT